MNGIERAIRESGQHPGWTPDMVADRIREAADTLKRLPDKDRPRPMRAGWPDVVQAMASVIFAWGVESLREYRKARNAETLRPGPPEPGAIDRMDKTFEWLQWISEDRRRKAIWAWANGFGDRRISVMSGTSRYYVKVWRDDDLHMIANRLNANRK